jgi:pimeloyl-ACP methyl ester carboxylesterase
VLWDQRGTYFSQPRLVCRETNQLPADADEQKQKEAYRRCGERLAKEAGDLSAFNSLENARDVDAVRAALGYEKYNFYGVSYGTELAQFLLRLRPPQLRSVVLDAVVPLGFSLVTDVPSAKQQVMQQYARACEESPSCNAAVSVARRALPGIARSPGQGTGALRRGGREDDARQAARAAIVADGQGFRRRALPVRLHARSGPAHTLCREPRRGGDFSFALNIAALLGAAQDDMADGMYMTVLCSEYGDTPENALRFPGVLKRFADAAQTDARQV